eukprot:jgi/Hompol1/152/HPOL_005241-RA
MQTEAPLVLSERFRRSSAAKFIDAGMRRRSQRASISTSTSTSNSVSTPQQQRQQRTKHQASSDDNDNEGGSFSGVAGDRQSGLPPLKPRGAGGVGGGGGGGGGTMASSCSSAGSARAAPGSANNVSGGGGTSGGGTGSSAGRAQNEAEAEAEAEAAMDDVAYAPFALSTKSSFNPARLSKRQIERLDPLTRAKYMVYDKPSQNIIEQIGHSERRSRRWLREEHRRIQEIVDAARKKWELLHKAIEDPVSQRIGEQGAAMARKRMREKIRKMMETREDELQFLVEGQSTSIDAIRLKEHLVIRTNKPKVDRIFSEKDRLRVEELLEQT